MKAIMKYVDQIDEELRDAKNYAECYVSWKSKSNMTNANIYKEMALQELQHATNLHQIALDEIEQLRTVFTPPEEMVEKWNSSHRKYVEKTAWVKQMLSM